MVVCRASGLRLRWQQADGSEIAAQLVGRAKVDAVDAEAGRRLRVARDIVDEDRRLRVDRVTLEEYLENARIGLDDADHAGDDNIVEPGEEVEALPLRRERFR